MIIRKSDIRAQFIRYAIVGLGSNIILYLAYLILTDWGMGHKTAMTLLYLLGVLQTFIFNRRWSFRHQGALHSAFARYIASYAFGYFLNLFVLWATVDKLGFPHQWVQALMVLVLAALLFLMQRYWVFTPKQINAEILE